MLLGVLFYNCVAKVRIALQRCGLHGESRKTDREHWGETRG